MKLYLVVWTILKFSTARPILNDFKNSKLFFENQFNKTFECFKDILEKGSSEHGLPSMSPLRFNDTVEIHTNNDYLKVDIVLDNLVIDGLTNYQATKLNLNPDFVMHVDFMFPKITINGYYSGKMNILGLYAVYGEGDLTFEFLNLNASTTVKHNILTPLIASIDTIIEVDNVNITITELMNDDDFSKTFSEVASSASTWFINNFQKNISDYLNPKFQRVVDNVIGNYNFLDYLGRIILYSCDN